MIDPIALIIAAGVALGLFFIVIGLFWSFGPEPRKVVDLEDGQRWIGIDRE